MTLFVLGIGFLTSVLATGIHFKLERDREIRRILEQVDFIRQTEATAIVNALDQGDLRTLDQELESILRLPHIHSLEVIQSGRSVQVAGDPRLVNSFESRIALTRSEGPRVLQIGELKIITNLEKLNSWLITEFIRTSIVQALTLLFLAGSFLLYFYYNVGRPLHEMTAYTQSLDLSRIKEPLPLRHSSPYGNDEFDQLATALNGMKANLGDSFSKLRKANLKLKREVEVRTKVEEALRSSEEQLRRAVEYAPLPIMISAEDGEIIRTNRIMTDLTGYSQAEIPTIDDLFEKAWKNGSGEIRSHIAALYRLESRIEEGEYEIITAAGEERRWQISSALLGKLSDGRRTMISMAMDVTKRFEMEAETKKLQGQLQQAQKMEAIGTLAGGIAHDFNNILAAINGYTELALQEAGDREDLRVSLVEVQRAGQRATELVRQILAFSRQSETPKMQLDLSSNLSEALRLLKASIPSSIEIRERLDKDGGIVIANPSQIHQIVMNLGTNAYQSMRNTGGTLSVSLTPIRIDRGHSLSRRGLAPGPYSKLVIRDTGSGMDARTLERIFEPYFSTKGPGEGTGLGLFVIHSAVKNLGGEITVSSTPGVGTVFNVYLPRIEPVTESRADHGTILATRELEAEEIDPVGRDPFTETHHILVVDDEEQLVSMVTRILRTQGYQISAFSNSVEALEHFQRQPTLFDLIITDMTMPRMNGAELAQRILAVRPEIPTILCTGYSEIIDEEAARALGISHYLLKPFTTAEICGTVKELLGETSHLEPQPTSLVI